jgi:outer membrane protein insertion porin family
MPKIIYYFLLLFLLLTKLSLATVIDKIEIEGNKRITKESIIIFGDIELKSDINVEDLDQILKKLYKSNFFENVSLKINNTTLIINVVENPIIQNVSIIGVPAKKIKEKILEIVKLKNSSSFVKDYASKDFRLIKNFLKTLGYYFVDVKSCL